MKKSTMRFKQFFDKLHKDNLLRSPYLSQILTNETSTLQTTKSINFNINLKQTNSSTLKQNNEKRPQSARLPSAKVQKPLYKQQASQTVKSFGQYIVRIQKEIKKSLKQNSEIEIKASIDEFKKLRQLCQNMEDCHQWMGQRLKQFEQEISKHLHLRITRIVFYFIYAKFLQCSLNQNQRALQLKLLSLCDQYSRILNIFSLSLYSCVKIQKIYSLQKNFEESKIYARKSLRLAVYLKDTTEQYKAIQSLKMLGFYTGAVTNNKLNFLSEQERQDILRKYHPIHDLPQSYKAQSSDNPLKFIKYEVQQFAIEQDTKISKNVQKFVSNFALMSKDLTDRSKYIMKTIKKVNRIGCVNKYLQSGNFISLQPRSRNMPKQNRGQVFLTHSRKKSQLQSYKKFSKFYLPKVKQMIESIIISYKNV